MSLANPTLDDIWKLFQETDRRWKETDKRFQETDKKIKEVTESVGRLGNKLGDFIEEMVYPAAVRLFQERGIDVHEVHRNVSSTRDGEGIEVDLLVVNNTDIVAIECKSTLSIDDVNEHLNRLGKLKRLLPDYSNKKVMGAVTGMIIPDNVAHYAYLQGLYEWKHFLGSELGGKTLGVIGTGAMGSAVAKKASAFNMQVIATTRTPSAERASLLGVHYVQLKELLINSDAITIHTSLNSDTNCMLGKNEFALMKPGVFLVNTARAEIIDQNALEDSLRVGHLGGIALDLIATPPLPEKHIFRDHPQRFANASLCILYARSYV